jgi:hypothetical protein
MSRDRQPRVRAKWLGIAAVLALFVPIWQCSDEAPDPDYAWKARAERTRGNSLKGIPRGCGAAVSCFPEVVCAGPAREAGAVAPAADFSMLSSRAC